MQIHGKLFYRGATPGTAGVAGAKVELWDADLIDEDDFIADTTTDDDGYFYFQFPFDSAHGNDPATVRIGRHNRSITIDAFRPYIKVTLDGVYEGTTHEPIAFHPDAPVKPAAQRIEVTWEVPRVALLHDLSPADGAWRRARQAIESAPYQWLDLERVPGAPDVTFDPPIPLLDPLESRNQRLNDIYLPPYEVAALLAPPPGDPTGTSYINERLELRGRLEGDEDAARSRDFTQPDTLSGIFVSMGVPASVAKVGADGGQPDDWFAEQRLTGLNPMLIARLGSKTFGAAPAGFTPDDARVRALTGWSWAELADHGRLYVCDYTLLAEVAEKYPTNGRFLPAPFAVFYRTHPAAPRRRDPGTLVPVRDPSGLFRVPDPPRELMPLAIQTRADGPITMPGDGAEWEFAKLQVQVADVNLHEMGYHLWGTHFSMEAFAVAAARSLAITHPLRELLRRHFYGLLWINQYGLRHLINTDGDPRRPVKDFLAPSFSGSIETMRKFRDGWSIMKKALFRDLHDRGLDDAGISLREYPYRDDGRLVWRAIAGFVDEYIDLYYDSPHDVRDDEELTNFYQELAEHHVPDIGRPDHADPAKNLDDLKEQIVQILWVSTALHNVLNQPQWPIAAYAANAPSASNVDPAGPAPLSPRDVYLQGSHPEDNTKQRTIGMMGLMGELALYNPDFKAGGLGHYRWWGKWKDDRVPPIVERFQQALAGVDAEIVTRNRTRKLKYEWLRPSLINNSTST